MFVDAHIFVIILYVQSVISLSRREDRLHPAVLVRHDEMGFIEGVYHVSGRHNGAFAYESENRFAIARDEENWVLGTMIPEPRLLCISRQHLSVLPMVEWECEASKAPSLIFLNESRIAHQLFLEARLEQTERRRPKRALMLYHAAYESILFSSPSPLPPYVPDILLGIGILSRYLGHRDDALKYLKLSAKHTSTSLASLTILGSLLYESKAFEEALDVRVQASKLDPQNFDVFRSLGETYAKLGRHREALESFHKARDNLEANKISYSAKMPSVSKTRAPLIWALVLTGIGDSLRKLGKDADPIWRYGSKGMFRSLLTTANTHAQ